MSLQSSSRRYLYLFYSPSIYYSNAHVALGYTPFVNIFTMFFTFCIYIVNKRLTYLSLRVLYIQCCLAIASQRTIVKEVLASVDRYLSEQIPRGIHIQVIIEGADS